MGEEGDKKALSATEVRSTAEIGELPVPKIPAPKLPAVMKKVEEKVDGKGWNTSKLGLRIGADFVAAASAGVLVAPVITMIDRGIIENSSGRATLGASLKASLSQMLLRPQTFFFSRPFALVAALYCGTYFTANSIDTASSTVQNKPVSSTTAGTSKFVATSSTNLALCLYKDNTFTKTFGDPAKAGAKVPPITFALFTIRDCLTIFASFNLPPLLSPHLDARMSDEVKKYISASSSAQFITPAAVQLVSTPLHLLGLDLFNRPGARWQDRAGIVVKNWGKSAFARMGRIVPAFGVGGVVNMKVRRGLMGRLEEGA
ncbi:hypothetical protein BDV96DRAFT_578939 [Lophiotrema nucula]|uniref:Sequence orphan n=1 Tax=Lophiotrema nucula TaxID=690887 RepID=A0A6A5Z1S9_9PLEO|nr:hypothetical protein BDV96DRAFT_578939 [Lophiotrema nucula]